MHVINNCVAGKSEGKRKIRRKIKVGPEVPPLTTTIKKILERYPGGQILKVRNRNSVRLFDNIDSSAKCHAGLSGVRLVPHDQGSPSHVKSVDLTT